MASFAKVLDGEVVTVMRAESKYMENDFIDNSPGEWVQCSYNTYAGVHYTNKTGKPSADQSKALRKNFAGIGFAYDKDKDAFIPPKCEESWILNETTCQWECPLPYPTDGYSYSWNDDLYKSDNTKGWVLESVQELD